MTAILLLVTTEDVVSLLQLVELCAHLSHRLDSELCLQLIIGTR